MNKFRYSIYNSFPEDKIKALIPMIATIIEGEDQAEEFLMARHQFSKNTADDYNEEYWKAEGRTGSMSVMFERQELFLHFHVFTESENQKQRVLDIINTYNYAMDTGNMGDFKTGEFANGIKKFWKQLLPFKF